MNTLSAPFVAIAAALVATIACAISVFATWLTSRAAAKVRSMISLQGELIEIRDYVGKLDRWAKRINAREVMHERRGVENSSNASSHSRTGSVSETKDELRRRAGIVAGRPAPHHEEH
jgi:hypothetical protein